MHYRESQPSRLLDGLETGTAVVITDNIPKDASKDQFDTLVQANIVSDVLGSMGYEPVNVCFSSDPVGSALELSEISPSLVFNLVESVDGRGDRIYLAPLLLESLGLPFTGCPSKGIFLTTNKVLSKIMMSRSGIRTPAWFLPGLRDSAISRKGTFIVKPVCEDASTGIEGDNIIKSTCSKKLVDEVKGIEEKVGSRCFAEEYIDGREFNISLLEAEDGPIVLPPSEIIFKDWQAGEAKLVGYRAKWDSSSFEYRHTVRSFSHPAQDTSLLGELASLSMRCWRLFGLRGYARVDFRIDGKSRPWVLEVNANPCLSKDSGFMDAARENGLEPEAVITSIVEEAVTRHLMESIVGGNGAS